MSAVRNPNLAVTLSHAGKQAGRQAGRQTKPFSAFWSKQPEGE